MCQSLLHLATTALGHALCARPDLPLPDLRLIPEEELAAEVFAAWQLCLRRALAEGHLLPLGRAHQVLVALASAFWQPRLLRLTYPAPPEGFAFPPAALPPGLASLTPVSGRLLHLDLSAPSLLQLPPLASACPQLRCLCLRGCVRLGDAALAAALPGLTSLQALDLAGLAQLTDAAVFHAARELPSLGALNLSGTAVGDRSLEMLVYGHRVREWQAASGAGPLPPDAAQWPALLLERLQVAGTRVTGAGLAELALLPRLRFLDARQTGVTRATLGPLQRRFDLREAQAAVLTDSLAVAREVVHFDAPACRCGCAAAWQSGDPPAGTFLQGSSAADVAGWQASGLHLLLHFDPAAGPAGLLCAYAAQQGQQAVQQRSAGMPGGRRLGYREPRQAAR